MRGHASAMVRDREAQTFISQTSVPTDDSLTCQTVH